MTKFMKMQIIWASVVFVLILIIGFLGVYALQKSMTIKMTYTVSPNIRCQIEMKKTGEADYTPIFSNVSGHEYIAPNMSLNQGTSNLQINQNFSGGIGSSFMLKYINYTQSVILAQVSGIGAMENAVICSAYNNATPSQSTQEFEVASITGNVNLTFSYAEAITVQKVVTNCTITGETSSYKNYPYFATINEIPYLRDTILIEIGTEDYTVTTGVANQGITYNKLTGGIYIPASIIDDNIVITVIRGYKVQYVDDDGTTVFATRYCLGNTTYGANTMPATPTKAGKTFQNWHGKNFFEKRIVCVGSMGDGFPCYLTIGTTYRISSNVVFCWLKIGSHAHDYNSVSTYAPTAFTMARNELTPTGTLYNFISIRASEDAYGFIGNDTQSNNELTDYPDLRIQIEYGTTATAFEAYRGVIDEDTQILNCDHNVYAVWA